METAASAIVTGDNSEVSGPVGRAGGGAADRLLSVAVTQPTPPHRGLAAFVALAAFTTTAEPFAQSVPTAAPSTTAPVAPPTTAPASTPTPPVTLNGYAEVFYSFNLNQPSSGITAYRAFDNRHNAFTISNVVLDGTARLGPTWVRVAAQVGHTPETYYLGEPSSPAAGGVGASDANVWKYLQQAYVGVRVPVGTGLRVEADIFLSPVGVEFLAVKDSWNWSRSTLFYSLPY